MNSFKGILFDFDGTLVKSMEDHFNAWEFALAEYGVKILPEDYYPLEGTSVPELAKKYSSLSSSNERPDFREIVKKKEEHYLKHHDFQLYTGVDNLIDLLNQKHVPIGIVTAALHDRLVKSTPDKFIKKFNIVVTGEKTSRGKPHPEPYLEGAKQLGLQTSECIVIENSVFGVRSAKSAGCFCIAISSTMSGDYLKEADQVVGKFEQLGELPEIRGFFE